MTIGERIRQERERRDWSIGELGRRAGVSRQQISNIEIGTHSPTVETLGAIAAALGIEFTVPPPRPGRAAADG